MNSEPNNHWIGDFHKALEQRNEPKAESYPLAPQDIRDVLKTFPTKTGNGTPIQPVSAWMKRMSDIGPLRPGPADSADWRPATVPCVWDSVSEQYVPVTSHRGVAILNPPVNQSDVDASIYALSPEAHAARRTENTEAVRWEHFQETDENGYTSMGFRPVRVASA